mmetsp:Transcript_10503/g.29688  ORF Transcript_10503/g.29688 Transcript_10503/m.29688 type:complete len:208 (+) Transcript_10503:1169-1792(+)
MPIPAASKAVAAQNNFSFSPVLFTTDSAFSTSAPVSESNTSFVRLSQTITRTPARPWSRKLERRTSFFTAKATEVARIRGRQAMLKARGDTKKDAITGITGSGSEREEGDAEDDDGEDHGSAPARRFVASCLRVPSVGRPQRCWQRSGRAGLRFTDSRVDCLPLTHDARRPPLPLHVNSIAHHRMMTATTHLSPQKMMMSNKLKIED